ncbi:MAG: tandem-95 repeat protein, partial [Gammaproteobacteria bacterium]|nr:tandem-95 repeat protein [Gammaproteobacteria bacterium]
MNTFSKLIIVFTLVLSVVACSSEQTTDQAGVSVIDSGFVQIKGVSAKGPISGATLEVIELDPNDGSETTNILATTTTDANGNWSVTIPATSHTNALLIKSSGGSYLDESDPAPNPTDKRRISFAANESIFGTLFPGHSSASVTMLTSALIEKSRTEANGSNFLNVLNNNRNIAASAIGFDPFTVAAADPLSPSPRASTDAIEYAMYLGGMATALNSAAIKLGVAVPTFSIIDAFIQDMSDGILNGQNQSGIINVIVNSASMAFPTDIDLNNAIVRFRNNNFAVYSVTPVTNVVSVNVTAMQTSGANNSPTAIDDNFTTVEGTQVVTGNVLSNDSDPDGDALTIATFTQPVNGSVVDNSNGTFTYTAPEGITGNAVFNYTVDDGKGGLDSADVIITVTAAPVTGGGANPTADAGTDQSVNVSTAVNLTGSGADSDGNITGYQWLQVSGTTVSITNSSSANASFTTPAVVPGGVEALIFQLQVTDNDSNTAIDFVTIIVGTITTPTNDPVANAGPDQTLNEQLGVTLDGTGSTDSDGTIVSYSWTQTAGLPTVSLVNAGTAQASFVGPNIGSDTTLTFFVIVTDNDGNSDTDSVDITMIAETGGGNENPVAVTDNLTTPQGISLPNIAVTVNDTDPNGDPVVLIGVTQPTNGTATNNGDGTVSYVPNLSFNGVDSFTYSVIDGQGGTDTGNVNITVDPDSDGDGILDSVETASGLDPNNPDHDGDGFNDGHEILISGTAAFLNTETPPGTVISSGNGNNTINVNTTWDLVNSPYWVQTDVNVQGGATLTIEAGVVVKFNSGIDLFVNASGILNVFGNAPIPQNVRFTSIFDDSLNGDTGGVIGTPGASNWSGIDYQANSSGQFSHASIRYASQCIYMNNSSPQISGVEVGDCGSYGIYSYSSSGSMTTYLHDITLTDFDSNSQSTGNSGIYIQATSSTTNTLDLQNLNLADAGGNANYYGLYLYANNTANITGVVDNLTITDVASHALYINNSGTGTINPTISNVSIPSPGSQTGLYLQNTTSGTLSPVFDGTNSISNITGSQAAIQVIGSTPDFLDTGSWTVNTAGYGMYLNNAGGNYNNITIDNTALAGIRLGSASNPAVFSDIVLTNATTPYELVGQNLTSAIIAGYDFSDASVTKSHIRLNGSLLADMTLGPDPLNNGGNSVWRITSTLTVPAARTLTVQDGAVLKFDASLIMYVYGTLIVGDGDGLGTNAVFTSILDDSVGGDTNGDSTATTPAWNNWNSIRPGSGSVVDIDNATIGYSSHGLYHYNVQSTSLDISNTDFHDVYYYGIQIGLFSAQALTMNLDTVSFTDTGVNTSYHGIYADIDTTASLSGTWNNVTLNNIGGSGIYINDSSSGAVDPTISGLTIADTGTVAVHGVQLIGNATTTPTFDNSSGSANVISGGTYNLTLQGVGGSYANLTLDGASTSSIYISNNTTALFPDDTNIILTNSPSPYTLISMVIPPGISYTAGAGLVEDYIIISGPITADLTLTTDPLNTATGTGQADDPTVSYWYSPLTLTINSGVTLDIQASTLMKFAETRYLEVGSGAILNINGTGGNEVYLTSFSDNAVGDPVTSAAVNNDWYGIYFRSGSQGGTISSLSSWYGYYGVYFQNATTSPVFNDLEIQYPLYGLHFEASSAIDPTFSNTFINQASRNSISFGSTGNISPGFSGTNLLSSTIAGSYDCIYNTSSSPNILISGWTIDGCSNGIDTRRAGTYTNNLIRNASSAGIYI